jgi:hypothetical protein
MPICLASYLTQIMADSVGSIACLLVLTLFRVMLVVSVVGEQIWGLARLLLPASRVREAGQWLACQARFPDGASGSRGKVSKQTVEGRLANHGPGFSLSIAQQRRRRTVVHLVPVVAKIPSCKSLARGQCYGGVSACSVRRVRLEGGRRQPGSIPRASKAKKDVLSLDSRASCTDERK